MSSEQEDVDGLPTVEADIKGVYAACSECNHDTKEDYIVVKRECTNCDESVEKDLLRRKDVAQLIQDKIEELGGDISRQQLRSEDAPKKKAVRVLGELLDEVENQR